MNKDKNKKGGGVCMGKDERQRNVSKRQLVCQKMHISINVIC